MRRIMRRPHCATATLPPVARPLLLFFALASLLFPAGSSLSPGCSPTLGADLDEALTGAHGRTSFKGDVFGLGGWLQCWRRVRGWLRSHLEGRPCRQRGRRNCACCLGGLSG